MKVLIGLFILGSFSVYAECANLSLGVKICADILEEDGNYIIKNIRPDIQPKKGLSKEICAAFGSEFEIYKIKKTFKRSDYYFPTRGFYAGEGMVSVGGGFVNQKVYAKIKCLKKYNRKSY